ncbi:unnamed protein product [Paramecium sonneborni]|uniref:ZZ-type domain-containing protein n=1 Tax=Paramecium sonneborni TaxID=65129 RepID=A0A8S1QCQ5_9CILI|nr:unnamed protein product [Paramecium sonneborni]
MKIKIVYNNEIHLLKSQNPTLSGIREHIIKIYPNLGSNFSLTYNDQENDQISLSCQEDLQVLIDEGIQTIKVFVITSSKPKQNPQDKMIHKRHTCDGCQVHPIIGSRFKCLECPDYDLCEECQVKNLHNHHKFFKISTQEELDQFRKEHWTKFGHWGHRGFGHHHGHGHGPHGHGPHGHGFGPHGFGPHGFGPHGHGPHGFGPHGFDAFKQIREFFEDPAFKEIKQTVCTIAKDVFGVIKTEIEKHRNAQQQQQEKPQEECDVSDEQETQQEEQPQKEVQQNTEDIVENDNQQNNEVEEKIRTLISILQCEEGIAREYVKCLKELPLNEIIDIILEKN